MSSLSSGGEYDSTGLRAAVSLNTPLLRCASPRNTRAVRRRFRDDTTSLANGKPLGFPFCIPGSPRFKTGRSLRCSWYGGSLAGALPQVGTPHLIDRQASGSCLFAGR